MERILTSSFSRITIEKWLIKKILAIDINGKYAHGKSSMPHGSVCFTFEDSFLFSTDLSISIESTIFTAPNKIYKATNRKQNN